MRKSLSKMGNYSQNARGLVETLPKLLAYDSSPEHMKTAIHWFRRDLRLTDNTALAAATKSAENVVPAYVRSTWKTAHRWTGP